MDLTQTNSDRLFNVECLKQNLILMIGIWISYDLDVIVRFTSWVLSSA
jgi:hypothetical protein